jgi:hypothetical protein
MRRRWRRFGETKRGAVPPAVERRREMSCAASAATRIQGAGSAVPLLTPPLSLRTTSASDGGAARAALAAALS